MLLRARDRNRTSPLESFWPGQQLGAGSRGLRGGKGRRSSGRAVKNRLSALPQLSNSGRSWRNFNAVFRRPAYLIVGRSTWPYTHAYIYEPLIRWWSVIYLLRQLPKMSINAFGYVFKNMIYLKLKRKWKKNIILIFLVDNDVIILLWLRAKNKRYYFTFSIFFSL